MNTVKLLLLVTCFLVPAFARHQSLQNSRSSTTNATVIGWLQVANYIANASLSVNVTLNSTSSVLTNNLKFGLYSGFVKVDPPATYMASVLVTIPGNTFKEEIPVILSYKSTVTDLNIYYTLILYDSKTANEENDVIISSVVVTTLPSATESTDIDTAHVQVVDLTTEIHTLKGVDTNCYHCLTQDIFNPEKHTFMDVESDFPFRIEILNSTGNVTHHDIVKFKSHAQYIMVIYADIDNNITYGIIQTLEGPDFWLPIIIAIVIFVSAATLWVGGNNLWRYLSGDKPTPAPLGEMNETKPLIQDNEKITDAVPKRVVSLDTFRGLSITIMIFVNYGGGGYWFFDHSKWNGLTFADLVFPWFIWIMGSAMAIALKSVDNYSSDDGTHNSNVERLKAYGRIVKRSCTLFLLGLFLNNGYDPSHWRIPGVLQRFGFSYLIVASIMFIPKYYLIPTSWKKSTWMNHFADVVPYLVQWVVVIILLIIYLIVQYAVDVPGCGTGYIGPGGIGDFGKYENCTGGAHRYIDILVLGDNHIYQWPTCRGLYKSLSHDPEGILGSLTSVVLCFLGLQAGRTLMTYKNSSQLLKRWIIWGIVFCLMATILCLGSKDNGPIPINKNLWSPSFIFVMAGTAFLTLSLCYILIDLVKLWNGAPFVYVGMNPIAIYCGHEVLGGYLPFSYTTASNTHAELLAENLIGVSSWLVIAFRMWQNKFFVKV